MKIKHILFILCFFVVSLCVSCSTDGSGSTTNENLVTKTWYGINNGNLAGNYSGATWSFTFADCEKISDTKFQVIHETCLYFYTAMPLTSTERRQIAEQARARCSNWIYYNQISESYKNKVTTLNNGIKFYRYKISKVQYASVF